MADNLKTLLQNTGTSIMINREINQSTSNETGNVDSGLDEELLDSIKLNKLDKLCSSRGVIIKKLQYECNKLKEELKKTSAEFESFRKMFLAVTGELKKQQDVARQRESESQTKTLGLLLDNEKLHILLESKDAVVDKLKKELSCVTRVLKLAVKGSTFSASEGFKNSDSPGVQFADSTSKTKSRELADALNQQECPSSIQ